MDGTTSTTGTPPGHGTGNGTAPDGYDAAAVERWAGEPDKRPGRTAFQL
jgi:dGTPase